MIMCQDNYNDKVDFLSVGRLHGLILQYMKALLRKAGEKLYIETKDCFGSRDEDLSKITEDMINQIDEKSDGGEGHMILLRYHT